jgi:hypothetical protein
MCQQCAQDTEPPLLEREYVSSISCLIPLPSPAEISSWNRLHHINMPFYFTCIYSTCTDAQGNCSFVSALVSTPCRLNVDPLPSTHGAAMPTLEQEPEEALAAHPPLDPPALVTTVVTQRWHLPHKECIHATGPTDGGSITQYWSSTLLVLQLHLVVHWVLYSGQ